MDIENSWERINNNIHEVSNHVCVQLIHTNVRVIYELFNFDKDLTAITTQQFENQ